jgi:hypothetical protein
MRGLLAEDAAAAQVIGFELPSYFEGAVVGTGFSALTITRRCGGGSFQIHMSNS